MAVAQVSPDFLRVIENVADDGIDFGESQGRVLLHDTFRRHALAKSLDEGIERHARRADTQHAFCIFVEGHRIGSDLKRHRAYPHQPLNIQSFAAMNFAADPTSESDEASIVAPLQFKRSEENRNEFRKPSAGSAALQAGAEAIRIVRDRLGSLAP